MDPKEKETHVYAAVLARISAARALMWQVLGYEPDIGQIMWAYSVFEREEFKSRWTG